MKKNNNSSLPICMLVGICLGAIVGLIVGELCGNVPIGLFGIPIGSGLGIAIDSIRKKK